MFLAEGCVSPYEYRHGASALIVSMPHVGTFVPRRVGSMLDDCAVRRADTDWHLARVYDFLGDLDATLVMARYSRYVVDVNRPADGENLYPGRDTPKLCPTDTFDRQPLYRAGEPDSREIALRLGAIWRPYHRRLEREIERVLDLHGIAILWDAHSIVSEAPRLFEGRLADFNLGTADGASCDAGLAESLLAALRGHTQFTAVLNARFKGGHITRTYGRPARRVHAIQLEMAEALYMDEKSPFTFRESGARHIRPILREQLELAVAWAASRAGCGQRGPRSSV